MTAVGREWKVLHPGRTLDRLTGNIPNEELYRFLKHADLKPGTYIDLGAGGGNFAQAMGDLLGWDNPDTKIYVTDKDAGAVKQLQERFAPQNSKPDSLKVEPFQEDYTRPDYFENFKIEKEISEVNGILWANNGHYYSPEKRVELMQKMRSMLEPGGKLIVVEYNTFRQHGPDAIYNSDPLPKEQLKIELKRAGFTEPKFLRKLPSSDQYMMYSAIAHTPSVE